MSRLSYRPEVDGLRAVAVLAVVFFHTKLGFPGGFVGVDIFFVISGFLITALISAEIAAGTFSLRGFWERRIRRIMPAATVTVLVTLVAGYFILLPTHFEELGRSAVAQALIAANIFFYRESGYFSTAAETKPLLHYWSLAVEEQFYLFFPILLLTLRRRSARFVFGTVATIAIISFGFSVAGAYKFPTATFFLLPTRAWELAVGCLLALRGCQLPLPEKYRSAAGWLGLGLMTLPMAFYDNHTPFPGLAALPPCLGAMLVIWATQTGDGILKQALSCKPVVWVGLLSYSLYLWHWPVKIYSHYWLMKIYSPWPLKVLVVAASLGLAWLSWRFVEVPFRAKRKIVSARLLFTGAIAVSSITIILGAIVSKREGLPHRFSPEVDRYNDAYNDHPKIEEADLSIEAAEAGHLTVLASHPGSKTSSSVLLWGDSHARVASTAVEKMCAKMNVNGYRASRSETASLLDYGNANARRFNQAIFQWIKTQRPTWVVLAARWEVVLLRADDEACLSETVKKIQALGVNVAVMRQAAAQRLDVPRALAFAALSHKKVDEVGVSVVQHEKFTRASNEIIDRVAQNIPGLCVLDPIPYLSKNGRCLTVDSGHALYYDNQHLTRYGSSFLTPMFASLFDSPLKAR